MVFYEDLKARPAEVWAGVEAFLGLPAAGARELERLEARSTTRPSAHYLQDLAGLRLALAGSEWAAMLDGAGGGYDARVDLAAEFAAACARHPAARMAWRRHACETGRAVPLRSPPPPPRLLPPGPSRVWRTDRTSAPPRRRRRH